MKSEKILPVQPKGMKESGTISALTHAKLGVNGKKVEFEAIDK